ncbi:hypothetical protein P8C59_000568 [Phyllachora maydis]|uniref:Xylanolytic transcriptional activator regulatory domain-containing protein n=1 Tax=Phyllachora maydis TaxID=1825666 RepID=A0AAD9M907_9PEZI|nr:hypothetical protein P8C59_000568 [Phyllachora maydis]
MANILAHTALSSGLVAAAAAGLQGGQKSPGPMVDNDSPERQGEDFGILRLASSTFDSDNTQSASPDDKVSNHVSDAGVSTAQSTASLDSLPELETHQAQPVSTHASAMDRSRLESPASLDLGNYAQVHPAYAQQMGAHIMGGGHHGPYAANQTSISGCYSDLPYALQAQSPAAYTSGAAKSFRMAATSLGAPSLGGGGGGGGTTSSAWMNLSSPTQYATQLPPPSYGHSPLRYPVLEPLMPHLGNVVPASLACDLIDLYFASSSSAQMHPMSPYVLGFVFRKRSFLHPSKPRRCQPALLASMLWVAAQTSDAPFLTGIPTARGKICQRLLELTVSLLNPLIHTPPVVASPVVSPIVDGVALGGLGVALPGSISLDALTGESGAFGAAGTLDDVVTYIHLATVVSASEYKGASLRWWNAAWSLARELKLGRELPQNAPSTQVQRDLDHVESGGMGDAENLAASQGVITEEEREERRRIWWLAYIVDRHLALCYNRPLFLLDIECSGLFQPMDDTDFQNGNFEAYTDLNVLANDPSTGNLGLRPCGPAFECRGHGIFGFFLPLMAILGEIVDLHHARNHPRFGINFYSSHQWDEQQAEITRHLEAYGASLREFEQRHLSLNAQLQAADEKAAEAAGLLSTSTSSGGGGGGGDMPHDMGTPSLHGVHSAQTASSATAVRLTESDVQTRIVLAYGTHVMHVLHILLYGKWDPINLLDDQDLWISSPGFIAATQHAVDAAEATSHVLAFDPGLEFMPFFFGIYLLQGSFLLLLIADQLQSEASASVVRACETIVRAHEACVVTLNTEYQRNFSRVMRSALAQARGRVPGEDLGEQHQRRRELLALYRWTGDGTGLAL